MNKLRLAALLAVLPFAYAAAHAQGVGAKPVPVTVDNFNRAETDTIYAGGVKGQGLGKFLHHREPISIDFHIVRPNRDTLYSLAVFDLDAGPLTITLPNAGQRFMSLQVIDEDHYTPNVFYGAGAYTFVKNTIGTRYISIGVRTLVDPEKPKDIQQVHALQGAIKISQPGGPGRFEIPNWDPASQKKGRDALLALAATLP